MKTSDFTGGSLWSAHSHKLRSNIGGSYGTRMGCPVKVGLKSEYQITSTATTAMSFTGLGEKMDDLEEFDYRYQLFRSGTF